MSRLFLLLSIFLITSCSTNSLKPNLICSQNSVKCKQNVLFSKSKKFKSDGRPLATIGTILYTKKNSDIYVLLGQERYNPKDKTSLTYSELGGGLDLAANKKSETFLQGIIRETYEESAGIYNISEAYLINNSKVFYLVNEKTGREVVYAFLPAPYFVNPIEMVENQAKFSEQSFHDKDKYLWLSLNDISSIKDYNQSSYLIRDINNHSHKIKFRPYFINLLKNENFNLIINNL